MKHLLLALLLALASPVRAQHVPPPLPTDSISGKVAYVGVVPVPGTTQTELYERAREWFARGLGTSTSALTLDDRATGKLVGRYHSTHTKHFLLGQYPMDIWRTLTVTVREGRYRYEMADFTARNVVQSHTYYDVEAPAVRREVGPYINQVATGEVASLAAAMQATAAKQEKPW